MGRGRAGRVSKPAMGLRIAVELLDQVEGFKYYKEMQRVSIKSVISCGGEELRSKGSGSVRAGVQG